MKVLVGSKEITIDKLKVRLKDWRELSTLLGEVREEELSDEEALQKTLQFYEKLLKLFDPSITREELEEMPVFQLGIDFMSKLFAYLFSVPLDTREAEK